MITVPKFTIQTYSDAERLFPIDEKKFTERYEEKSDKLKKGSQKSITILKTVALFGIISALGSIFAILAAHQVFPNGLNAISNLNPWGYVIGYSAFGAACLISVVSSIKTMSLQKKTRDTLIFNQKVLNGTIKGAQEDAFRDFLADNEYIVMEGIKMEPHSLTFVTNSDKYFYSSSINFEQWLSFNPINSSKTYGELLAGKSPTDLESLHTKTAAKKT